METGWLHVEEHRNAKVFMSGLSPDIAVNTFVLSTLKLL
jgi:hypothetical protein